MDDIVKAALAKWPNVPHCYGWLGLDARGQWFMRDDRVQAAGPFAASAGEASAPGKGSLLRHDKLIEFIHRNYAADEHGRLYLKTALGIGLVHTNDMALAADAVEAGRWEPAPVQAAELPGRCGYVQSPQQRQRALGKPA